MAASWVRAASGAGVALLSCIVIACGGSLGGPDGNGGEPGVDEGVAGMSTGGSSQEPTGGAGGTGGAVGSGGRGTGGAVYMEQECPDEPPPPVVPGCDPLSPREGCPDGQGCYPYLVYPNGQGCGFPTFGAQCAPASSGAQGEVCGMGSYCEPGFMCVIGATAGARCAQVCSLVEPSGCPPGLVCNETDVLGYGVCF